MTTMTHHEDHKGHSDHEEKTIETLSTPPIQIPPASLSRRITAGIVDSLVITLAYVALIFVGQGASTFSSISLNLATSVYLIVITFAYYFVLEGTFASTVGKSLLKLRVLGKDGDPCSFRASFQRNILRFIDWLPVLYLVAAFTILTSRDRQRVGDRVAATVVTRAAEKDINPPPAPFLFH